MGEDRTIRDIMKKIKDVEDSTRRKIQSTENHITLLMESQYIVFHINKNIT